MKTVIAVSVLTCLGLAIARLLIAGDVVPSCTAATCCPRCGCHEGLVPVCHTYCTTKTETKYHYLCKCDTICIPDHCPSCPKCGDGCCEDSCENGKCNCLIKTVHKLAKVPYTVETPVRKCTIEWVCPNCGCSCGTSDKSAQSPALPMTPLASTPH